MGNSSGCVGQPENSADYGKTREQPKENVADPTDGRAVNLDQGRSGTCTSFAAAAAIYEHSFNKYKLALASGRMNYQVNFSQFMIANALVTKYSGVNG